MACLLEGERRIYFFNLKNHQIYETLLPNLLERRRQNMGSFILKSNPNNPNSVILVAKEHFFVLEFDPGIPEIPSIWTQ